MCVRLLTFFLYRSSLYVRIQSNPSVDLLSSSLLSIPAVRSAGLLYPVSSMVRARGTLDAQAQAQGETETETDSSAESEMKRYIVLCVRNGSRQIAAISTSQSVAVDSLRAYVMSSRDHLRDHPLHAPSGSPTQQQQSQQYTNSRNQEPFLEFLEPESTKNLIYPLDLWRAKNPDSVQSPSGLFWALYDPFSSSLNTNNMGAQGGVGPSSLASSSSPRDLRGNIRCGVVLGAAPADGSSASVPVPSAADSSTHLLDARNSNVTKSLSANVLLFQKGVLVFENSYTVNTRNNFRCQLWETYDLHLKVTSLLPPTPPPLPLTKDLALPLVDSSGRNRMAQSR